MTIETDQIIEFLSTLARDEQLKVTVTQCVRGAAIAGAAAGVGGLIAGPFGLAAGAALGGVGAAAACQDFKSVAGIIGDMGPEKKERLAELMKNIMKSIDIADVTMLIAMVSGSIDVKKRVVSGIVSFFKEEMDMTVANY